MLAQNSAMAKHNSEKQSSSNFLTSEILGAFNALKCIKKDQVEKFSLQNLPNSFDQEALS